MNSIRAVDFEHVRCVSTKKRSQERKKKTNARSHRTKSKYLIFCYYHFHAFRSFEFNRENKTRSHSSFHLLLLVCFFYALSSRVFRSHKCGLSTLAVGGHVAISTRHVLQFTFSPTTHQLQLLSRCTRNERKKKSRKKSQAAIRIFRVYFHAFNLIRIKSFS